MNLLSAYNEVITIGHCKCRYRPVRLVATSYKDVKRAHLTYWKKAEYYPGLKKKEAVIEAKRLALQLGIQFDPLTKHGRPCRPPE